MEIKTGDKFFAEESNSTYTVIRIEGERVNWDCVGRKFWMKNVTKTSIIQWIEEGRLKKI